MAEQDKKDVASKLAPLVEKLRSVLAEASSGKWSPKARDIGVTQHSGANPCLNALTAIFERQINAQYGAHKMSMTEFHPIQPGTSTQWDDAWTRYMTLWLDAMIDEIEETRNWLNWKSWKKPQEMTKNAIENARFELIDLIHFWINAYFMLGGTPESLVVEFHAKRDENDNRQKEGY